jgi:hypothetical protein
VNELMRGVFNTSDLVSVPRPNKPVVLVSGGPIMDLISSQDGNGLVEWRDDEGKICRAVIALVCLYECRDMGGYIR